MNLRVLGFVLLSGALTCFAQTRPKPYSGPYALGPYEARRGALMSAIFDHLKVSSVKEAGPICFRSTDGTFLWIERMGVDTVEERKLVGRIFVSTFRNCVANPIHETPENVGTWKTKEGIGLGSTRQDVLKAYGKPSADTLIRGNLYRCLIVGDCQNGHPTLKPKPDIGDEVLKYTEADTLFETDFGLRNGIVIWVSISENP